MPDQTALLVTKLNTPVVRSTEYPIPTPSETQVLLRVTVTALNPHDQKVRDWGLGARDLPVPISNDIVGVVEKLGSSVTKLSVGDRVFTYGNFLAPGHFQSGLQEYALADEDYTIQIPEGLNEHDVATVPVNLSASAVGLFDEKFGLGIPAPWTDEAKGFDYASTKLLIIGGGSNCGRFAVQLAKLAGVGKIVVLGGREEELKSWGASEVLDRHGGDEIVHERIMNAVGEDLVYIFDAVNEAKTLYVGINALSSTRKGMVARLLPTIPHETAKVTKKDDEYVVRDVFGLPQMAPSGKGLFKNLEHYLAEGRIVPLRYEVADGVGLNAETVNEVLDRYRDGKPVVQTHFRISK